MDILVMNTYLYAYCMSKIGFIILQYPYSNMYISKIIELLLVDSIEQNSYTLLNMHMVLIFRGVCVCVSRTTSIHETLPIKVLAACSTIS